MWLIIPLVVGLVLIIAGSVLFGGVFTLVAVPILIAAVLLGFGWRGLAHVFEQRNAEAEGGTSAPSTAEASYDPRRDPSTPGELADARRGTQ
jgi:hypothetical protein